MSRSKLLLRLLCGIVFFSLPASIRFVLADPPLAGDFDGNRYVNVDDFTRLAWFWLEAGCGEPNWCDGTDLDHSSYVDYEDVALFAGSWQAKDWLQLDKTQLTPLQPLNITVRNASSACSITVTTPAGDLHTFSGTIAGGVCTASYIPSFQAGTYLVSAVADGVPTETEECYLNVTSKPITIRNWSVNTDSYYPERDLTFTFDAVDRSAVPLAGFSGQTADSRADSTSGQMSILRQIKAVAEDGTITARIFIYFDTTGSWSNIYAGTTVQMSLYSKTGGAVPSEIMLMNGTREGAGYLSNELVVDAGVQKFNTTVTTGFAGADKVSFLDIVIPPSASLFGAPPAINTGAAQAVTFDERTGRFAFMHSANRHQANGFQRVMIVCSSIYLHGRNHK